MFSEAQRQAREQAIQAYRETMAQMSGGDSIIRPKHYHKGGIDVIGFARLKFNPEQLEGFFRINALKYLTRYDEKGQALDDLRKAQFYVNALVEMYEQHEIKGTP